MVDSAIAHHPHVHMIVPAVSISLDATHSISSRPAFLLPMQVLGKLVHRPVLAG